MKDIIIPGVAIGSMVTGACSALVSQLIWKKFSKNGNNGKNGNGKPEREFCSAHYETVGTLSRIEQKLDSHIDIHKRDERSEDLKEIVRLLKTKNGN